MEFRWHVWNLDHIAEHGISASEAEFVVENAGRGYPRSAGAGKFVVWGQTAGGNFLQVVFVIDPSGTIFIIHARPLTSKEKRNFKKRG